MNRFDEIREEYRIQKISDDKLRIKTRIEDEKRRKESDREILLIIVTIIIVIIVVVNLLGLLFAFSPILGAILLLVILGKAISRTYKENNK